MNKRIIHVEGDMSSALHQALITDVFVAEASGREVLVPDIRIKKVTIEYEVRHTQKTVRPPVSDPRNRTPLDVIREHTGIARRTGGCAPDSESEDDPKSV